jgi:ubiquinone/menaquinone biosynthesis C-methylase UbiE
MSDTTERCTSPFEPMTEPAVLCDPVSAIPREATPCLCCGEANAVAEGQSRVQMGEDGEHFTFVRCTGCGLVFLNPRVPETDIGRYYEDYLPHRGPEAWGRWAGLVRTAEARTDRARVRTIQSLGALTPAEVALDVGCGRPSFLRLLKDQTGARVVGTDFDASGWSKDPAHWQGLSLYAGVLESLPLTAPFDRITLWHVLEHLYQPVETLRHLRTLARPGTLLVIEVPDLSGLTRRLQGSAWAGYHTPRHTAAYTAATLKGVLERSGWRIVRQYPWGTLDPYVLWWLGQQERQGRTFSGSMESRFLPFMLGKIAALPVTVLQRWVPLGFQTAIAVA